MKIRKDEITSSIVNRNFQAAAIFNYYGIDFFANGRRTLEHACIDGNVSLALLIEELSDLKEKGLNPDVEKMPLADLSDYILRTHHAYAEKKLVFVKHTIDRLSMEPGYQVSSTDALKNTFTELSVLLTVHMKYEEFILFPFIKKLPRQKPNISKSKGLENSLGTMIDDHSRQVLLMRELVRLTNNYTLPPSADYALKITYQSLKELENDLKIHMHLENNVLSPRVIQLTHRAGVIFSKEFED